MPERKKHLCNLHLRVWPNGQVENQSQKIQIPMEAKALGDFFPSVKAALMDQSYTVLVLVEGSRYPVKLVEVHANSLRHQKAPLHKNFLQLVINQSNQQFSFKETNAGPKRQNISLKICQLVKPPE